MKSTKTNRRNWKILRAILRALEPKLQAIRAAHDMLDDYDCYRKKTLC